MNTLADAILDAVKDADTSEHREHLGASLIGDECLRKVWYSFRWYVKPNWSGRMLRLFDRGAREEPALEEIIRRIPGVHIATIDHNTGKQFRVVDPELPALRGSLDGMLLNPPEAPDQTVGLEIKTSNHKNWDKLKKSGVKSAQRRHYTQMNLYAFWFQLPGFVYVNVNKDTDALYSEWIPFDSQEVDQARADARTVLTAETPPRGISKIPSWWQCKFCPMLEVCHFGAAPDVNCRTCVHVESELIGANRWSCSKTGEMLTGDEQRAACAEYKGPVDG